MEGPGGISVTSDGTTYVVDYAADRVLVFAPGADGEVAPVRVLAGAATGLMMLPKGSPRVPVDEAHDPAQYPPDPQAQPSGGTAFGSSMRYAGLSAEAVRVRCAMVHAAAERDALTHFRLDAGRVGHAADYVLDTMRANYPTLAIPYHSRWRHFAAGGRDRWAAWAAAHSPAGTERARLRFELGSPHLHWRRCAART